MQAERSAQITGAPSSIQVLKEACKVRSQNTAEDEAMPDTTIKKVSSGASPKGEMGQVYLVSGKRVRAIVA